MKKNIVVSKYRRQKERAARLLREVINEKERERWHRIRTLTIPFGKYSGHMIQDIPLSYLDGTISPMPDSLLVRSVRWFVDYFYYEVSYHLTSLDLAGELNFRLPDKSLNEMKEQAMKERGWDRWLYDS